MKNSKRLRGTEATIDRMAQVMIEIGEGASERDLLTRGFTQDEVNSFGHRAAAQANSAATHEVA